MTRSHRRLVNLFPVAVAGLCTIGGFIPFALAGLLIPSFGRWLGQSILPALFMIPMAVFGIICWFAALSDLARSRREHGQRSLSCFLFLLFVGPVAGILYVLYANLHRARRMPLPRG